MPGLSTVSSAAVLLVITDMYNKYRTKPVDIQNYSPTGCPMTDMYKLFNKFQNKPVQGGSPAGYVPTGHPVGL